MKFVVAPPPPMLFPLGTMIGGVAARLRLLPHLRGESILVHGQLVSAQHAALAKSKMMFGISFLSFVFGLIVAFNMDEAHRRHIARMPRWQRWVYWPVRPLRTPENTRTASPPSPLDC